MSKIRVEHVLNQSVDDVFAPFTDGENYKNYPGFDSPEWLERTGEGALRLLR